MAKDLARIRAHEASALDFAAHVMELRAQSVHPGLTDQQLEHKRALMKVFVGWLREARDETIELMINEWQAE